MLRTNCKKALENIRAYIFDYAGDTYENNEERTPTQLEALAYVYECFKDTYLNGDYRWGRLPESEIFREWAQGLPIGGLFCYYYNREALDDLGAILEETEEEKARFAEEDAEKLLTNLIYREVSKAATKLEKKNKVLDNVAATIEEIGKNIENLPESEGDTVTA